MNYRLATILAGEAHTVDITKIIDLKLSDPVSQFHILYKSLNVGNAEPTGHPAKCITKIELVDGSDVLYSLSGQEAQAVDYYHRLQEPGYIINYLGGMNSEMVYNLNFGRFAFDPLFAFDPKKHTNPQLKITVDINGGGAAVASGNLRVLASIFDGKVVTPTGFLMHKEIKDYALGASAHEYTDLPTDFPYRKLFIKAQKYGTGPVGMIENFKLSEDNDKKVPFNITGEELGRLVTALKAPYREVIIVNGGASGWKFYCTPTGWPKLQVSRWEGSAAVQSAAAFEGDGGRGYTYFTVVGGNFMLTIDGYAPHGVVEIPFGRQDDPEDWYDASKLGSLRLDIQATSGMTSSEYIQVFMQQLRSYGAAA